MWSFGTSASTRAYRTCGGSSSTTGSGSGSGGGGCGEDTRFAASRRAWAARSRSGATSTLVAERQVGLDVLERRGGLVALGRDQLAGRDRPLDAHVRVVELDPALVLVGVVVRLLVED